MTALLARRAAGEAVRDVPWAVGAALVAMIAAAALGTGLALGQPAAAAHDLGLAVAWLAGALVAARLGLSLRMDPLVLCRPVSRADVVVGHVAGGAAGLAVLAGALVVTWVGVAATWSVAPPPGLPVLALLLWLEWTVTAAEGALLAAVLPPRAAPLALAALWAVGHLADPYFALAGAGGVPGALAHALFAIVPDLDLLDVQRQVVDGVPLDPWRLGLTAGYAVAWTVTLSGATVVASGDRA